MSIIAKPLINGEVANALSVTRYCPWVDMRELNDVGFAIHTVAAGAPVGTFSFEGSNDTYAVKWERDTGIAPASSAARKFPITVGTVHGSALAITGVAADSYVSFSGGLPCFMRVRYLSGSGGSAASLWYLFLSGRGNR